MDRASAEENYIIRWPSLFHERKRGFGLTQEFMDEFGVSLEIRPEMDLEAFMNVVAFEMTETSVQKLDYYHPLFN